MKRRQWFALSAAAAMLASAGGALAQSYPTKTVKLQVPFAPAVTADLDPAASVLPIVLLILDSTPALILTSVRPLRSNSRPARHSAAYRR